MTFFTAATYAGGLVFLLGGGIALRAGASPAVAFVQGLVGFGLLLVLGFVAELVVMSGPLRSAEQEAEPPLIRTLSALTGGAPQEGASGPGSAEDETRIAA